MFHEYFFLPHGLQSAYCHYFNKIVSHINIFHPSLNDKDQNDKKIKV